LLTDIAADFALVRLRVPEYPPDELAVHLIVSPKRYE